ncbi:PaaX family transcriptional regulator [Actinomycetospora termitidis]|uniref:PaaX family transcriptional regulator C-terminal domain-containing protein n=1 Tax=Actinomycetospora termitidis TaxID=3053470 RepID=A0ABT7M9P3_9PSEU|nr:PaaX family transcriptional regulator C-terminal domain-containing protein [Actinomycetospora sp. Odt1-22]MDL5156914.1 PaaX family transcriptional regulator C-terminal domain-containing protein [Actinomycetospora sp. Odt1-22]
MAAGAGEAFSRRREVAATSARSLLLTVLGEFVLPAGEPVWTQTLLDALGAVAVEEKSARQALARTAADDVVFSERSGRRVRWSLTSSGRRLLSEGAARIYAHGTRSEPWDGRWVVLVVSVPEAQRALRHQLRTQLAWAGLGSPAPGVWVCPDASRVAEAHRALTDVGLGGSALVVVGGTHGGLSDAELVAQAWDLRELEARYAEFVDQFAELVPEVTGGVLAAQVRLVDAWRRFPFLDPQLPAELLPADWVGARAAEVFHARHEAWAPGARAAFAELSR